MSTEENIYDQWHSRLDGVGTMSDAAAAQKTRLVAARAQIDQAISLATIADSLDALVAHVTGRVTPEEGVDMSGAVAEGIQSEHDVEVGDMVVELDAFDPDQREVTEVGIDQGQVWLKLDGSADKVWGERFEVIERGVELEQREGPEVVNDVDDSIDDDFATDAGDADVQQADALATLRARQAKKGKRSS